MSTETSPAKRATFAAALHDLADVVAQHELPTPRGMGVKPDGSVDVQLEVADWPAWLAVFPDAHSSRPQPSGAVLHDALGRLPSGALVSIYMIELAGDAFALKAAAS